jgi:phosphatidylglycerophosphatase A
LVCLGSPALYWTAAVVAALAAVWVCGKAETILGETDPPSVVLDEIVALPFCYAATVLSWQTAGIWPGPRQFLLGHAGLALAVFALFRVFDIAKPWPIRASQRLPGGWGVVVDDVLAALCVSGVLWFASRWVRVI